MRRTLIASSVVLAGLLAPAAACASVVDAYQRLAARNVTPAPLVPTTVPSTLAPADRTITQRHDAGRARLLDPHRPRSGATGRTR